MDPVIPLLATAAVLGLYMAWNIGANDVANAMGTSVGSGALTLRWAIVVAAVFEFSGALLVGGTVTQTISKGIIDLEAFGGDAMIVATGMTCCLAAAALWLHVATHYGWPVSTTHSIVGAVLGFGLVAGGLDAIDWGTMGAIVASWVISPLMGGVLAFVLFIFLRNRVLAAERPLEQMRTWGPVMVFPIFAVLSLALMFKGLEPLRLDLPLDVAGLIALGVGTLATVLAIPVFRRLTVRAAELGVRDSLRATERVFTVLQILTACFVAFAHGSNDVANAVGPMAAVFSSVSEGVNAEVQVPLNVLLIGAVGIVVGLATYGYKVMATIGKEITELTPSRGFTAEFAAASTIVLASKLGLPVSTTHTLVGAVIGVGFARSVGAINKQVVRGIVTSWFITVPFTAGLAAVLYVVARLVF
jgi:PiT family inorganic phosphate transporter